jgi:hypothetical protein
MVTIYLAHSIHERERGKLVQAVLCDMGFKVLNPFEHQPNNSFLDLLDKGIEKPFEWTHQVSNTDPLAIDLIDSDLKLVAMSDGILCLYPEGITVGISCEMFFAWTIHRKVVAVVPTKMLKHPWIVRCTNDHVYDSEDEAIDELHNSFEFQFWSMFIHQLTIKGETNPHLQYLIINHGNQYILYRHSIADYDWALYDVNNTANELCHDPEIDTMLTMAGCFTPREKDKIAYYVLSTMLFWRYHAHTSSSNRYRKGRNPRTFHTSHRRTRCPIPLSKHVHEWLRI